MRLAIFAAAALVVSSPAWADMLQNEVNNTMSEVKAHLDARGEATLFLPPPAGDLQIGSCKQVGPFKKTTYVFAADAPLPVGVSKGSVASFEVVDVGQYGHAWGFRGWTGCWESPK